MRSIPFFFRLFSEFKYSQDDASVPGPSASSHSKGTRSAIVLAKAEHKHKQDDNIKAGNCVERLAGRAHTLRPAHPTCAWQGDQVRDRSCLFDATWIWQFWVVQVWPLTKGIEKSDHYPGSSPGLKSLTTDQYRDEKDWKVWLLTKFKTKRILKLSRWEDRVALEDAETGEQIRYGELSAKVEFFFLQSFLFAKGGGSCVRSHAERFWRRRCHCGSTS